MVATAALTVIPYERRYRTPVLDLIRHTYLRHTHFDWYDADEWLDNIGGVTRLAWRSGHLAGVMGASHPFNGAAWVRVACVSEGSPEDEVIGALWESVRAGLRTSGAASCWLLALDPWIEAYTNTMGMSPSEMLVSLRYGSSTALPAAPVVPGLSLEPGDLRDVAAMAAIDQRAFVPPFQMTYPDVRHAYRHSTTATVARLDDEMVGYQISTRHGSTGHLARLAVLPEMQGRGIGGALVREVLAAFRRRQVEVVTVNTQGSNLRSQTVYQAYGFQRSGYDMPMFSVGLNP